MPRNSGALVVGYRREDLRRFRRSTGTSQLVTTRGRLLLPGSAVTLPDGLACNRNGGPCISCGRDVYLNDLGWSALTEKDADVCCMECESRYSADISRSL